MDEQQTTTEEQPYRNEQDPALLYAWQLYIAYNDASDKQKMLHTRLRSWVIVLGLVTSSLAIASALPSIGALFVEIEDVIRFSLIALPIIIAGMMTFASHFSPSLGWIVYRVGAETIRREIYLYRMKATDYSDEKEPDIAQKQRKLLENIEKVNREANDLSSIVPFLQRHEPDYRNLRERVKTRFTDTPSDDGFSPLEGEQYLQWRIIPQRNWYIDRINKDYRNLRWSRTYMIVIAGLGSLLAASGGGIELYVVVTTAAGLAASTYVQLRMYGQTYIGYHITAKKLDTEIARWMTLSPEQQQEREWVAAMVQAMEDIFQNERMLWMQVATQAQTSGEQALIKNIGEWTNTRFGLLGEDQPDAQPSNTIPLLQPSSASVSNTPKSEDDISTG